METITEDLAQIPTIDHDSDSSAQDLLIRKWFATLTENFDYVPSDSLVKIWIAGLRDLDSQTLSRAFDKILKTWKPEFGRKFPVIADVRSCIDKARSVLTAQAAEDIWQDALEACMHQYHPDCGWSGPRLSARVARAIAAANGVHYLCTCSEDDLVWAKKRFVECYLRAEEIEDWGDFLPSPERPLYEAFCESKSLPRIISDDPPATKETTARVRYVTERELDECQKKRREQLNEMIEIGKKVWEKNPKCAASRGGEKSPVPQQVGMS